MEFVLVLCVSETGFRLYLTFQQIGILTTRKSEVWNFKDIFPQKTCFVCVVLSQLVDVFGR